MAKKLLPVWQKVLVQIHKTQKPTEAESALLQRMTSVFEKHIESALSMTEG